MNRFLVLAGTKKGKMDFKSHENSGTDHWMPEQNLEYADLNDIGLYETNPYDNKAEQMGPDEPDRSLSRSRRCNHMISIISVAVLSGSGIVLCLLLVCKLPGINCIYRPPSPTPSPSKSPPPQGCTVWRGTTCHYKYYPNLSHVIEIRLIKETVIGKEILFIVSDLTNDTNESAYDPPSKINFTVSVEDAKIEVIVHILDTQCSHNGNYNILSISDENGFIESFWRVNVLAQCPCQMDLNIISTGAITCSFPNAEHTSVIIQKVSGDNQNLLVNESGIIRPIDLQTTNGFSATWSKDGTLNIKLVLGRLNCSHEGDYNITVTMNGTSILYDVYLNVIDYPQTPVLTVESAGIIENKGGQISCSAMTGCGKAHFELELSGSGNGIWDIWRENCLASFKLTDLGWIVQCITYISMHQVTNVDKRKFRCSYRANGEIYISNATCIGIIPVSFCPNKIEQCDYQHPYLCNKYITCTSPTNPLERPCPTEELHFLPSGSCGGSCVWPWEANCTYKNYCDYN